MAISPAFAAGPAAGVTDTMACWPLAPAVAESAGADTPDSGDLPLSEGERAIWHEVEQLAEQCRSDLSRLEQLFDEGMSHLMGGFDGITQRTRSQEAETRHLYEGASSETGFAQFSSSLDCTLKRFLDSIRQNEQVADMLVQHMQTIVEQVQGMGGVLDDIEKITRQTQLLALNAAIELHMPGNPGVALLSWPTKSKSWQPRPVYCPPRCASAWTASGRP